LLPDVIVHLDDWITEHPHDKSKLKDSEFLRRAVGESMRLHQTSPVRFRIAERDVTLSTGRKVKAGEMLALYAPPPNLETEVLATTRGTSTLIEKCRTA
jgi:cytochrome P450